MSKIRDSLQCPRILTEEEVAELDFNEYTTAEIKHLIACCAIKERHVIEFYGNEFWDDFTQEELI